jgi:hypothetical protein
VELIYLAQELSEGYSYFFSFSGFNFTVPVRCPTLLLCFIVGYSELEQNSSDAVRMLWCVSQAVNTNFHYYEGKRLKIMDEKLGMDYTVY